MTGFDGGLLVHPTAGRGGGGAQRAEVLMSHDPLGPFSPFSLKMIEAQCATRGVNSLGPRRDTLDKWERGRDSIEYGETGPNTEAIPSRLEWAVSGKCPSER